MSEDIDVTFSVSFITEQRTLASDVKVLLPNGYGVIPAGTVLEFLSTVRHSTSATAGAAETGGAGDDI